MIERLIVMGADVVPKAIKHNDRILDFAYEAATSVITVRQPNISAMENFVLDIQF
jgi:hypothetical protein